MARNIRFGRGWAFAGSIALQTEEPGRLSVTWRGGHCQGPITNDFLLEARGFRQHFIHAPASAPELIVEPALHDELFLVAFLYQRDTGNLDGYYAVDCGTEFTHAACDCSPHLTRILAPVTWVGWPWRWSIIVNRHAASGFLPRARVRSGAYLNEEKALPLWRTRPRFSLPLLGSFGAKDIDCDLSRVGPHDIEGPSCMR